MSTVEKVMFVKTQIVTTRLSMEGVHCRFLAQWGMLKRLWEHVENTK